MLQLFIVREIIKMNRVKDYHIIFIDFGDLNKDKINEINEKNEMFSKFHFLKLSSTKIGFFISLTKLMRMKKINCDNVYVACINSFVYQYLLSKKVNFNNLYSFDDGMANIVKTSVYYTNNQSRLIKSIKRILNVKLDVINVKSLISKHYTVYPVGKVDNILPADKCVEIKLINSVVNSDVSSGVVNILLGTVYSEIYKKYSHHNIVDVLKDFIESNDVDIYMPHPREERIFTDLISNLGVRVLISNDLTERYIVEQLLKYERVNVYGFYSTILANISNINGISSFCISNNNEELAGYGKVLKSLGVKML